MSIKNARKSLVVLFLTLLPFLQLLRMAAHFAHAQLVSYTLKIARELPNEKKIAYNSGRNHHSPLDAAECPSSDFR